MGVKDGSRVGALDAVEGVKVGDRDGCEDGSLVGLAVAGQSIRFCIKSAADWVPKEYDCVVLM